jgi:FkbM family methyltransferase
MSLKRRIQAFLQRGIGFKRYLVIFSAFKILTLRWDKSEGEAFQHFLSMLPNKGAILDIGANVGIMTVHLAQQRPNARVYAVEPIPDNFAALQSIITLFGCTNVRFYQTAVGSAPSLATMTMPLEEGVQMQGLSHIVHHKETNTVPTNRSYSVSVNTLDILFRDITEPVIAIKIDVENYEAEALRGASALLKKYRPLLYVELWENQNKADCMAILAAHNYTIMVWDTLKQSLVRYNPQMHQAILNYFFVP